MLIDDFKINPNDIKGNKIISLKTLHRYTDMQLWENIGRDLIYARTHNDYNSYARCYKFLNYMEKYRSTSPVLLEVYRIIKNKSIEPSEWWYTGTRLYKDKNTYKENLVSVSSL